MSKKGRRDAVMLTDMEGAIMMAPLLTIARNRHWQGRVREEEIWGERDRE